MNDENTVMIYVPQIGSVYEHDSLDSWRKRTKEGDLLLRWGVYIPPGEAEKIREKIMSRSISLKEVFNRTETSEEPKVGGRVFYIIGERVCCSKPIIRISRESAEQNNQLLDLQKILGEGMDKD